MRWGRRQHFDIYVLYAVNEMGAEATFLYIYVLYAVNEMGRRQHFDMYVLYAANEMGEGESLQRTYVRHTYKTNTHYPHIPQFELCNPSMGWISGVQTTLDLLLSLGSGH